MDNQTHEVNFKCSLVVADGKEYGESEPDFLVPEKMGEEGPADRVVGCCLEEMDEGDEAEIHKKLGLKTGDAVQVTVSVKFCRAKQ